MEANLANNKTARSAGSTSDSRFGEVDYVGARLRRGSRHGWRVRAPSTARCELWRLWHFGALMGEVLGVP
jgi:hypothetical protein